MNQPVSRLAYDVCRCDGRLCERRETCARHVLIKPDDIGPRTPFSTRLCVYDDLSFIPVVVQNQEVF